MDREKLAIALYTMFEMRTSRPWDQVGPDGVAYPDLHMEWLEAADELIARMEDRYEEPML